MKKFALLMIGVAAMGLAACTGNSDLPPGTYKSSSSSKSSNGTDYSSETTTKVELDDNGNKVTETKTKDSTDPEGLFNKSTTKTKTTTVR